jgi:hypothetical protein
MSKYKIGFVGEAEVLFAMMAKLLPIDHVTVEDVTPPAPPRPAPAIRFGKRFDLPKPDKPKQKRKSPGPDLTKGINGIILTRMSDGKTHRAEEFRPLLKAAGFSESSVSSRMEELRKHGVVKHLGEGKWKLVKHSSLLTATTEDGPV